MRELEAYTPALVTGPGGGMEVLREGELAEGFRGTLIDHRFAQGRVRRESTVVLGSVPESIAFAPAIVCRDRGAMGKADLAQLPAETWEETKLESVAFGERYRLYTLAGQDAGWVRELFSPQLIAWLDSRVPEGLSWELNQGHLTVALPGRVEDGPQLEELCGVAAQLAERIRKEAAEEGEDPDLFRERREIADLDAAIPRVGWKQPPASVQEAIGAYRSVARRSPAVLVKTLVAALVVAALAGAVGLLGGPAVAIGLAVLAFAVTVPVARWLFAAGHRFGSVGVSRVGLEAWAREYAASRGMVLEDRWAFHAEVRDLRMPGVADHVMSGPIPGCEGLTGRLVMLGDAPEMRSEGREIAFTANRPLAASAILVEAPEGAAAELDLPEEYAAEQNGNHLMVWRPVAGNLIRTSEGTDRFCTKAGRTVLEGT